MNPRITVIIPVYNVEKYLARCLDSVLAQTFRNFEVICVDDASPDSSNKILRNYADKDKRIKVLRNQSNEGLSHARNVGLIHARGKYVYFLDSDDAIAPECLERTYAAAERDNAEIVFFGYREKKEEGKEELFPITGYICDKIWNGMELFVELRKISYMPSPVQFKLWRKSFLDQFGLQFYEGIYHEDLLFYLSSLVHAERITCLCDILYNYYRNPNSITGQRLTFRHIEGMVVVIGEVEKLWKLYNGIWNANAWNAVLDYIAWLYIQTESRIASFGLAKLPTNSSLFDSQKKAIYAMVRRTTQLHYPCALTVEQLDRIKRFDYVIVYGAGRVAEMVIPQLFQNSIENIKVAVSRKDKSKDTIFGLPVKEITEIDSPKDKSIIVLAVGKRLVPEIRQFLTEMGYMNVLVLE